MSEEIKKGMQDAELNQEELERVSGGGQTIFYPGETIRCPACQSTNLSFRGGNDFTCRDCGNKFTFTPKK